MVPPQDHGHTASSKGRGNTISAEGREGLDADDGQVRVRIVVDLLHPIVEESCLNVRRHEPSEHRY